MKFRWAVAPTRIAPDLSHQHQREKKCIIHAVLSIVPQIAQATILVNRAEAEWLTAAEVLAADGVRKMEANACPNLQGRSQVEPSFPADSAGLIKVAQAVKNHNFSSHAQRPATFVYSSKALTNVLRPTTEPPMCIINLRRYLTE